MFLKSNVTKGERYGGRRSERQVNTSLRYMFGLETASRDWLQVNTVRHAQEWSGIISGLARSVLCTVSRETA